MKKNIYPDTIDEMIARRSLSILRSDVAANFRDNHDFSTTEGIEMLNQLICDNAFKTMCLNLAGTEYLDFDWIRLEFVKRIRKKLRKKDSANHNA